MDKMHSALVAETLQISLDDRPVQIWAWHVPGGRNAFLLPPSRVGMIVSIDLLNRLRQGDADGLLLRKLAAHCCSFGVLNRREIRDQPLRPTFIMIDVTTRCNLNCSYCLRHFPDEGSNIARDKVDDILDYVIRYCHDQRITTLSLQPWGGEPLIAADTIFYIQDRLKDNGIHTNLSVQTNGLFLSESMVDELHRRGIRIGVSLDGCREVQDVQRASWNKAASFDLVCHGIGNLKKRYGNNFGSISVVTHQSLPYLKKSLEVFCHELGMASAKLNPVHPNGDGFDAGMLLTDEDIPVFVDMMLVTLQELNQAGHPFFESNVRDKLINLLCGKCREICHSEGCTGGYASVTFSRNGDIYPCELIGHEDVRLGSIYDGKGLPQLLKESISSCPYFMPKHSEECDRCPWWSYCRGGCTASCMSYGQAWGEADSTECRINKVLYPRLIELILTQPQLIRALTNEEIEIME